MKTINTTKARERFAEIVNSVRYSGRPVAIGRRDKAEVLMIKFPDQFNENLDEATNINQYGEAFDFLRDEPDLYSAKDLKKSYV